MLGQILISLESDVCNSKNCHLSPYALCHSPAAPNNGAVFRPGYENVTALHEDGYAQIVDQGA